MISKGLKIFLIILFFIIIPGVLAYFIYDSFSNDKYGNYRYAFIGGAVLSVIIGIIVATRKTPKKDQPEELPQEQGLTQEQQQQKLEEKQLAERIELYNNNKMSEKGTEILDQGVYDTNKIREFNENQEYLDPTINKTLAGRIYKFYQDFINILELPKDYEISLFNCMKRDTKLKKEIIKNNINSFIIEQDNTDPEPRGFYFSKLPFTENYDDNKYYTWIDNNLSTNGELRYIDPNNCDGIIIAKINSGKLLEVSPDFDNSTYNTMNEDDFCEMYTLPFKSSRGMLLDWKQVAEKYPGLISPKQTTYSENPLKKPCLTNFDDIYHTVVWNSNAFKRNDYTNQPMVNYFSKDGSLLSKLIRKHFPEQQQLQAMQ